MSARITRLVDCKRVVATPHAILSARELEVFRHIALGLSVSQIADLLQLSVKTISTYRVRILDKMDLDNNAQMTMYGLRMGLIESTV